MAKRGIRRRDFLNGMALGAVTAGAGLSGKLIASPVSPNSNVYPPALTGIRGSHDGSYEVAHAVAWAGKRFPPPRQQTESTYDLVVVGGGISGLAAARFYREKMGSGAKILVLDNHDDFGGHARRNELDVDGQTLLGCGGSQTLQNPGSYSREAKHLLQSLSLKMDRFYDYFDQEFYSDQDLGSGIYFDRRSYGVDRLVRSPAGGLFGEVLTGDALRECVQQMPISEPAKQAYLRLYESDADYLAGKTTEEKKRYLRNVSYDHFLEHDAGMPAEVRGLLQDTFLQLLSVGWEAGPALHATYYGMPGTWYLGIEFEQELQEPYIHHFPDGNAGVARALVRDLIPSAVPGSTMEDLVLARADYGQLDRPEHPVRIRLNSTAVSVVHTQDEKAVDVTYVNAGNSYRVRTRHVVMACYNNMIPYLCPELPPGQSEAIRYATKIPFVIASIGLRNWRAFKSSGYSSFYTPGDAYFKHLDLDFPVSMGGYEFSKGPDSPIVLSAWFSPTQRGLPAREQYRAGRRKLYEMRFEEYESDLRRHLNGMLGIEFDRDVAAITLNRWSHGYAYEYEEIGTPASYGRSAGPHIAGRAQLGRISIANSDSEAYAYVDGAIDAAYRAVQEQLS